MKAGDLVIYKGDYHFNLLPSASDNEIWLVLGVTKTKKTWHRDLILFSGKGVISIPWGERFIFEVISELN